MMMSGEIRVKAIIPKQATTTVNASQASQSMCYIQFLNWRFGRMPHRKHRKKTARAPVN
jgi:hypothetical protein